MPVCVHAYMWISVQTCFEVDVVVSCVCACVISSVYFTCECAAAAASLQNAAISLSMCHRGHFECLIQNIMHNNSYGKSSRGTGRGSHPQRCNQSQSCIQLTLPSVSSAEEGGKGRHRGDESIQVFVFCSHKPQRTLGRGTCSGCT